MIITCHKMCALYSNHKWSKTSAWQDSRYSHDRNNINWLITSSQPAKKHINEISRNKDVRFQLKYILLRNANTVVPHYTTATLENSGTQVHIWNSAEHYRLIPGYSFWVSLRPKYIPFGNPVHPVCTQNNSKINVQLHRKVLHILKITFNLVLEMGLLACTIQNKQHFYETVIIRFAMSKARKHSEKNFVNFYRAAWNADAV